MEQATVPSAGATEQKHSSSAKNFFLYFLQFALLYGVVISLGAALFAFINKFVPQPAAAQYAGTFNAEALRYNLASLIIASPIFLWLARKIFKDERHDAGMRSSGIRRWLTYITLIIAALVSIGDLINLVFRLLGGEMTTRFTLKALIVLVLAGGVFYYFLNDVKSKKTDDGMTNPRLPRVYFLTSSMLILVVTVVGFFNIGTPMEQRSVKQDQQRVEYLNMVQVAIDEYYRNQETLPASLSDIQIREMQTKDPVTGTLFKYEVIDATSYRLCATFETSNKTDAYDEPYYYDNSWLHDEGEQCFTRSVNYLLGKPVPIVP
jgi:type II secretory pathway pseudopilin PulG